NVRLRIDKDVAHFFRQKTYFPLQKIKRQNRDGSLIVECKACQYEEVINTIKHWIPYVTVESPKGLKQEIIKNISNYLRKIKND
ncbi:MAG: WYL domain-containing protein, partial [Candidatus Omnitrophica bacterium]|nr:WYL domain-containing protein [Candidatus Omnitrophota bacterium]